MYSNQVTIIGFTGQDELAERHMRCHLVRLCQSPAASSRIPWLRPIVSSRVYRSTRSGNRLHELKLGLSICMIRPPV
jgi:hypothetical protein